MTRRMIKAVRPHPDISGPVLALIAAVILLVAAVVYVEIGQQNLGARQGKLEVRETRVEHTVTTVQRELVLTPCLNGNRTACRVFIDALLKAATPAQLARLRGANLTVSRVVTALSQPSVQKLFRPKPARKPVRHRRRSSPTRPALTAPLTPTPPALGGGGAGNGNGNGNGNSGHNGLPRAGAH